MTTPSAIPRPTRARLGVSPHRRRLILLLCSLTAVLAASPLGAQAPPASFRYIEEKCVPQPSPNPCSTNPRPPTADSPAFCDTNLFVCNILPNCVRPTVEGPYLEVVFEATGDRTARYVFDVIAPWNNFASAGGLGCNPNGTHDVVWRSTPFPSNYCPAGQETLLEPTQWDHYETWVRGSTLSCSMSAPAIDGPWYVLVKVCQQPCCTALCPPFCSTACICGFQNWEERTVPMQEITPRDLGCERPPARPCADMEGVCCLPGGAPPIGGTPGGALTRPAADGGAGLPVALTGIFMVPEGGAPADFDLSYFAGAAGRPGFPGSVAWSARLGQGWSHAFAQRVVADPDEQHVWLIDGDAGFTEFDDLAAGFYTTILPADEKRTLEWLGAGAGWLLVGLDGSEIQFGANGQWQQTTDRLGKTTTALYSGGALVGATLPDGRAYALTYHGSGKLESISEIGLGGTTTRTWSYQWSSHQLATITMPDGRIWEFEYSTSLLPRMTRQRLVPAGGGTARVERGWEYDADGVLLRTWKGAESFGAAEAVEQHEFAQPAEGETVVTDPYGNDTTYTWERELDSGAPRVLSMVGDCPSCGASPETTWQYTDGANPLRPTVIEDALGRVTEIDYDALGMVTNRREAVGTPETRETFWAYDEPAFPAFPTTITRPSVIAGCPGGRTVDTLYDPGNGRPTSRVIAGCEQPGDASVTSFTTTFDYTGTTGPEATTIDPPGHGTADQTTSTYDPARGDLFVATRTVPNPTAANPAGTATTGFHYDDFNRRIGVTDPNGVTTEVQYDDLDRVRFVIQRSGTLGVHYQLGDPPNPADLATEHRYDAFGELALTILPEGNAVEYGYDAAGRLLTIDRRADDLTPATERTEFTLDAFGHRILEDLQSFEGGDWVSKSKTASVFTTRCHLDKVIHNPDAAPQDQEVTEYGYDCEGNLARVWDAEHPKPGLSAAEYAYDALDRLAQVGERWGGPSAADACPDAQGSCALTDYGYDLQDHLTSVTDAEFNTTTYVYNDRDLLVREVSPVSGTTAHAYDPHGELATTTDARGVVVVRAVDAADRVTHIDYGTDDTLDVDYAYGTQASQFEIGRLIGITRRGETVTYEYDQFGRTLRDGELTLTHDENGNVETVTYPGGIVATYGYDLADRPKSLAVDTGSGPVAVAGDATYLPSGPLTGLDLGNGLTETRGATERYFPASITVTSAAGPPPLFAWDYTVDAMGNVTGIDGQLCPDELILAGETVSTSRTVEACQVLKAGPDLEVAASGDLTLRAGTSVVLRNGFSVASGGVLTAGTDPGLTGGVGESRSYEYQDYQHFLTGADGPWGALDWTYDTIGNRLDETRDVAAPDLYVYPSNGTGNLPRLTQIQLGIGGTRDYSYGPAGHVELVQSGANPIDFVIDDEGRLGALDRFSQTDVVVLEYDGRSFLCRAEQTTGALARTEPVYDSQGRVMTLRRYASGTAMAEPVHYFYFAGRPVAQLAIDGGGLETWTYLTTDHLGTPVLATDSAAGLVWQGGFEPFGRDWRTGTGGGARENGIFLRLPGQWDDGTWEQAASAAALFYNVHRWYEGGTGRYTRADPLGAIRPGRAALFTANHLYAYAASSPTFFVDPLGLKVVIENPDTAESYDQFKQCFPLFRNIAEHFENDTWTDFGPDRTWTIKDPDFDPPACMVGGRRSEVRTIWVPPGRDCEGKMRCLFHEFYELWLIRAGGFKQFGPAGPAHDQAKAGEEWIPFEKCCPCDADGGQPQ